jgi:2-methylisocitrate lyase-like PEP mutase family enzyme
LLTALGFEALATTSAGLAFSLGRKDGAGLISRREALANARAIIEATTLPVSADLENGFDPTPEGVAITIRLAAEIGLVGGSIEDATYDLDKPIFELSLAVERIAAAVESARAVAHPFVVTARAENFSYGRPDLTDTICRLTAFEAAGADVLYAPDLPSLDAIREVCSALSRPVNVVMGLGGARYSVGELADAGVKRISLGSSLCRAALGEVLRAAQEVKRDGTFRFSENALTFEVTNDLMSS